MVTEAMPQRFAVPRAGEDHVFHAGAAQALGGLFAQHPTDGVAQIRFAAAVRAHDGGDARPVEPHFGPVAERLKTLDFDAFQFQQNAYLSQLLHSGDGTMVIRAGHKVKRVATNI